MSSLRRRVIELESIVEQVSGDFLWLSNEVMNSGLLAMYPDLAQKLQATMERGIPVLPPKEPSDDDNDEKPQPPQQQQQQQQQQAMPPEMDFRDRSSALEQDPSISTRTRPTTNTSSSDSHDRHALLESNPTPAVDPRLSGVEAMYKPGMYQRDSFLLFPWQLPPIYSANLPYDGMPAPFGPYKFEESTLVHRVMRCVVERGYQAVKTLPDNLFPLVFGFLSKMLTKDQIITYFKARFLQGIFALDSWRVPFIGLGGAGSHYPRDLNTGETIFPMNMLPDSSKAHLLPEDLECPWFDIYDVLGYLKERGIMVRELPKTGERATMDDASIYDNNFTMGDMHSGQGITQNTAYVDSNLGSAMRNSASSFQPVKRRYAVIDETYLVESEFNYVCIIRIARMLTER